MPNSDLMAECYPAGSRLPVEIAQALENERAYRRENKPGESWDSGDVEWLFLVGPGSRHLLDHINASLFSGRWNSTIFQSDFIQRYILVAWR